MLNAYEVLGLGRSASQAEIQSSYRKLMQIFHPDKGLNRSHENFLNIQRAYQILMSQESRRQLAERKIFKPDTSESLNKETRCVFRNFEKVRDYIKERQ